MKCKSDILLLNVLRSILQNVGIRERDLKLLLETFTYIAITETVTCIIKIETVI